MPASSTWEIRDNIDDLVTRFGYLYLSLSFLSEKSIAYSHQIIPLCRMTKILIRLLDIPHRLIPESSIVEISKKNLAIGLWCLQA